MPGDVSMALVWTGISTRSTGASSTLRCARQHRPGRIEGSSTTDKLPDYQKVELVSEALKERDEWAGRCCAIQPSASPSGFPAKLVTIRRAAHRGKHPGVSRRRRSQPVAGRASWFSELRQPRRRLPAVHRQGELSRPAGQLVRRLVQARRDPHLHQLTCHSTGSVSTEMTASVDVLAKQPRPVRRHVHQPSD